METVLSGSQFVIAVPSARHNPRSIPRAIITPSQKAENFRTIAEWALSASVLCTAAQICGSEYAHFE
jgi:hypothetical protein